MVFTDRGRWYITADDDLSGDSRHFRVDRIRSIEKTGEYAAVSTIAAEVPVWFADAQDNIVVSAHVSPAASWVIETYPCKVLEEHADGSFDISIVANSAHWLGRLLLRAGGGVVVTAPASMVDVYAQVAADVLVRYRSSNSDT
jgi:proteasome accessory factor C